MKLLHKRWTAILLTLSLTLLPACGGTPASSQSTGPTGTVAMGRYVEQDCPLPAELAMVIHMQQRADGSLLLAGYGDGGKGFHLYSSDDGTAWQKLPLTQLEATGMTEYNTLYEKPDGTLVVAGNTYSDELLAAIEAGDGFVDDDTLEWPRLQVVEVSPDGAVRDLSIQLPPEGANSATQLLVSPEGDIFMLSYTNVYQFDAATGSLKNTFSLNEWGSSIALNQNRLAVMSSGTATLYDTDSGDRLGTVEQLGLITGSGADVDVSYSGDNEGEVVAVGADGYYYFCNSTGIYCKTAEGELLEHILDGSLVSLGVPSLSISHMLVLPDSLFVALRSSSTRSSSLKKYTFDPTVPTLPSKELRIYSLDENKTVRQAMGQYQLQYPDTHVVLEVAPAEQSNSDALRALNTRLLAGNGPDILVLDGMPVEAYLQKNVLLPLEETLTEGLLPNIVQGSRSQAGKLYALPARVALPAMTGPAQLLAQIQDMESLVQQLTVLKAANPIVRTVLQNCGGNLLLNTFYPLFSQQLYTDGKPDEQKLRSFLESLGQIADLQDKENAFVTEDDPDAVLSMVWNSVNWALGTELLGMGQIDSLDCLAVADSAAAKIEGGAVQPFLLSGSHPYIPSGLLGITSGSANQETATAFLRLALSAEVQTLDFEDGLPVNEQALGRWLTPRTEEDRTMGAYGGADDTGKTSVVTSKFPQEASLNTIRGWVEAVDTPVTTEITVLELLRTETEGYFAGNTSLDDTVAALMQKLTLLEAE